MPRTSLRRVVLPGRNLSLVFPYVDGSGEAVLQVEPASEVELADEVEVSDDLEPAAAETQRVAETLAAATRQSQGPGLVSGKTVVASKNVAAAPPGEKLRRVIVKGPPTRIMFGGAGCHKSTLALQGLPRQCRGRAHARLRGCRVRRPGATAFWPVRASIAESGRLRV